MLKDLPKELLLKVIQLVKDQTKNDAIIKHKMDSNKKEVYWSNQCNFLLGFIKAIDEENIVLEKCNVCENYGEVYNEGGNVMFRSCGCCCLYKCEMCKKYYHRECRMTYMDNENGEMKCGECAFEQLIVLAVEEEYNNCMNKKQEGQKDA